MSEKCAVYDVIVDGCLWYVGMSSNPTARLYAHRYFKTVPKRARVVVVEWHDSRKKAADAEARRIIDKNPPANKRNAKDMARTIDDRDRKARNDAIFAELRLRNLRMDMQADRDAGMSLGQVADKYGVSRGTVRNYTMSKIMMDAAGDVEAAG